MIILVHDNQSVLEVKHLTTDVTISIANRNIVPAVFELAQQWDEFVIWVHSDYKNQINKDALSSVFHHKKIMASYASTDYFAPELGFVHDATPNVNVDKSVKFATWLMASAVGGIHLSVVKQLDFSIYKNDNLNYFLYSVALIGMYTEGLFCYSEPRLVLAPQQVSIPRASKIELFRFVHQHQRTRWTFFLLLSYLIYKKECPLIPFFNSFFFKKRKFKNGLLDGIDVRSSQPHPTHLDIDVIIPTIGRKSYLHDVLKDFSKQTILPKKIIIVEQNPDPSSVSELDYLTNETWPFLIEHLFIHQSGACNARNLALDKTTSNWVFLADDDNRFESNLIEKCFDNIKQYGCEVLTTSYLQQNEKQVLTKVLQWHTFGAGNSIVLRDCLNDVRFDMRLEFGYGEDADFGMQLRYKGYDVIYFPNPNILHLKAPIGGFRTKPVLPWHADDIQPKPSPTIMLYALLHKTVQQRQGYQIRLFIKNYRNQKIKNPIAYIKQMKKQWDRSMFWATHLIDSKP